MLLCQARGDVNLPAYAKMSVKRLLIKMVSLGYHCAMKEQIITSSPEVMGGTPVFAGTRVPVQTLVDYLKGGESIDEFLEGFPSVTKRQVIAFLEEAEEQISKMVS